jgi:peptide chain release factor
MIWLMLSAGRGPGECELAVAGLLRAVLAEAAVTGVDAAVLDLQCGRHGLLSALVALDGDGADTLARSWEGSLLWVCPSPLRPGWGRKRWFIGGSRLSPPGPANAFREADLRFETMRASGPGGQHINKTESAVRLTHVPTDTVVAAREERSQHRNRALALARLHAALEVRGREARRAAERERWTRHNALERGNPVRSYECPATIRMDVVLPHPAMLPNGPSIASSGCSRRHITLSIGAQSDLVFGCIASGFVVEPWGCRRTTRCLLGTGPHHRARSSASPPVPPG